MTRQPITVQPDLLASSALDMMKHAGSRPCFVVDAEGCPIGILHVHDLIRAGVI